MAVDTAFKRFSMMGVSIVGCPMRVPDATDLDEVGDRRNGMFLYSFEASTVGSGVFGDRRRRAMIAIMESR